MLKNGKSPGFDDIPIELLQCAGDEGLYLMNHLCLSIWDTKQWAQDWEKSVFAILPKKRDTLKRASNRAITPISHASKVILKIIAGRMKNRLDA